MNVSTRSDLVPSLFNVEDLRWSHSDRAIVVKNRSIEFTRTEFSLLAPLCSGRPVTYADLATRAYGYLVDAKVRAMMDKHIDRIRGKLRGSGIYVYCILGYGYVLLPEVFLDELE